VPQFAPSLEVLVQAPLQKVSPAGQTHAPSWQVCPPTHALPHAPQFAGSLVRSMQATPHGVYPALQSKLQVLAVHAGWAWAMLVVHAVEHDPQCAGSLVVSAQVDPQSVGVLAGQPVVHE
jgi:hypothetical protein